MILRRIARPMLAAVFVSGGIEALRNPKPHMQAAEPVLDRTVGQVRDKIPDQVPTDTESLVKLDAAIKVGAGLALALNKCPRLASLLLAVTVVPTTAVNHRFWEIEDPKERAHHRTHFLQSVSQLGGLLIAAADTHGKPSLSWRARRAARTAGGRVNRVSDTVQGRVHHATDRVQGKVLHATDAAQGTVGHAAGAVQSAVAQFVDAAQSGAQQATGKAHSVTGSTKRRVRSLLPS